MSIAFINPFWFDTSTDPNFADVVLLIGADTSIVDESTSAKTLTIGSGITRNTSNKKFGAASVDLPNATGGTLTAPASADWNFGLNSFTLEAWVALASDAGGLTNTLFAQDDNWYTTFFPVGTNQVSFAHSVSSAIRLSYTWTYVTGQFYHIAVTRNHGEASGTWRLFIDGVMVAKVVDTVTGNGQTGSILRVGGRFSDNRMLHGQVDEVRITKNVARYVSDAGFTPPTAAFPRA